MKYILYTLLSTVLLAMFGCEKSSEQTVKNEIVIDTDHVIRKGYYGGAVQWEPNDYDAMNDEQWQRLFNRVEYMKLGYIRCVISPYTYCLGIKEGKPQYVWKSDCVPTSNQPNAVRGKSAGADKNKENFTDADWLKLAQRQWADLLKILDFCEKHNIDVMFGDWWFPADEKFFFMATDDPQYARIITDCVEYLVKEKGYTCIKEYNMGNEVNLNPPGYTWEKWSAGIKNIYKNFEEAGLSKTLKIVGPDGGYWGDLWFNNTINELDKEVQILDYHWYINNDWLLTNRVEDEMRIMRFFTSLNSPQKPIIFGEVGVRDGHNTYTDQHKGIDTYEYGVGMADILIQSMRAGWSGIVAWDMDDAMHYHNTGDLKEWGFWNSVGSSKGKPETENIRPWFYTWSLLSRNFPKGSDILHTNSFRDNGLNCVAVKTPDGDISFAIVNNTDFAQSVNIKIPTINNQVSVDRYVYFEQDRPVDNDSLPVVKEKIKNVNFKDGVDLNFFGKGFILLTTIGNEIPELTSNNNTMYDPLDGLTRIFAHSSNLGMNGYAKHYDECRDGERSPFGFSKFKQDHSTIHPSTHEESAYIVYKMEGVKDFDIKVSGNKTIDGRFKVYGSSDNLNWKEVAIIYPTPELTIWDWYHTSLYPVEKLDNTNYLKIEMNPNGYFDSSRLREVTLTKH